MAAKKSFPLRIDAQLFNVIEHWAADELRSVNAQIEFLLRESARKAGKLVKDKGGKDKERDKDGATPDDK